MKINDYELIYLIQKEQDCEAKELLIKKYQNFIWKYVHQYCFQKNDKEDYFQEGLMALNQAVLIFDENRNKTFTRFFELILKRRFITLIKGETKLILHDDFEYVKEAGTFDNYELEPNFKSDKLQKVYKQYFVENKSIDFISKNTKLTKKQIYNAIHRIKEKCKK